MNEDTQYVFDNIHSHLQMDIDFTNEESLKKYYDENFGNIILGYKPLKDLEHKVNWKFLVKLFNEQKVYHDYLTEIGFYRKNKNSLEYDHPSLNHLVTIKYFHKYKIFGFIGKHKTNSREFQKNYNNLEMLLKFIVLREFTIRRNEDKVVIKRFLFKNKICYQVTKHYTKCIPLDQEGEKLCECVMKKEEGTDNVLWDKIIDIE